MEPQDLRRIPSFSRYLHSTALNKSKAIDLYLYQGILMYSGVAREEGRVNDCLLHEIAMIRVDELREEVSRGGWVSAHR